LTKLIVVMLAYSSRKRRAHRGRTFLYMEYALPSELVKASHADFGLVQNQVTLVLLFVEGRAASVIRSLPAGLDWNHAEKNAGLSRPSMRCSFHLASTGVTNATFGASEAVLRRRSGRRRARDGQAGAEGGSVDRGLSTALPESRDARERRFWSRSFKASAIGHR
jgi:hypothetical protein